MIVAIADTHAALWYLSGDPRLSLSAKEYMLHAAAAGDKIGLSCITLIEIVYLVEKGRLPPEAYRDLRLALTDETLIFTEIVISSKIADALAGVPRSEVPDMPDRIIAATAISLNLPVISRDRRIRASAIHTIW